MISPILPFPVQGMLSTDHTKTHPAVMYRIFQQPQFTCKSIHSFFRLSSSTTSAKKEYCIHSGNVSTMGKYLAMVVYKRERCEKMLSIISIVLIILSPSLSFRIGKLPTFPPWIQCFHSDSFFLKASTFSVQSILLANMR